VEYDTSYLKKETTNGYNIYIEWQHEKMPWNEICAKVIEIFGLPGDRYVSSPSTHFMVFRFKSEKDFMLAEILLSEYLTK
jgi:hypothetical protein